MFRNINGSTQTIILIVLAVLIAGAGIYYLTTREGEGGSLIMRTYHCNACNKDFEVDLNKLGTSKPACPYCSTSDVKTPKKQ